MRQAVRCVSAIEWPEQLLAEWNLSHESRTKRNGSCLAQRTVHVMTEEYPTAVRVHSGTVN